MDTPILFWIWTAAFAVFFVHARLLKLATAHYGKGHLVPMLIATIGIVMTVTWCFAMTEFLRAGWPGLRTCIAVAIYVALAIAVVRAIGPKGDAAPLFKRFPLPALPAPDGNSTEQMEIQA